MSHIERTRKVSVPTKQSYYKKKNIFYYFKRDFLLYMLCVPIVVYYVIFKYIPMYGITIAFKNYNIFTGISGSSWVGFDVFKKVFGEQFFWNSVRNTIVLNLLTLLSSFPLTIILALMLNEARKVTFRRISQSMLYLPHFVSWVVVAGLVENLFSVRGGSINNLVNKFGFETIPFLIENSWWVFTYVISHIWKDIGWGTIIYLAALSGVDEALYESAYIDGATKLQRIWNITLPCIRPTIAIMFILSISRMLSIGLDAPLLLQNSKVIDVSEVISTYVYKMGLQRVQYSFATAVGLFQSIINIILLLSANAMTKMMGEEGVL